MSGMKRIFSILLSLFLICSANYPIQAAIGFSHGERDGKRIALSFDDGPHPTFTPQILAMLDKYSIKATFFMIGCNVALYPDVAKKVNASGHEIGNHTYSHPHMKNISLAQLSEEVSKTEKLLADIGIAKPKLFRPPEGFRSMEQVKALETEGYQTIIWSLDTHDWQGRAANEIISVVLSDVQGGDILLFHDYTGKHNTTITALEQLIPRLLKDGYKFVTVSELMC